MNSRRYAFIIHNRDKKEDGNIKTMHIHLAVIMPYRIRKSTLLNELSFALQVPKECISIEECRRFTQLIQYLVHKNQPEKTQYSIAEIVSNYDKGELTLLFNSEEEQRLTPQELIEKVIKYSKKSQLLIDIGLDNYKRYVHVINSIWNDYH